MRTLKFERDVPVRRSDAEPGSWADLVAWFSTLVDRLDKGDLPGAVEAQKKIECHGFKVTFRRRSRLAEGGVR